MLYNEFSTAAAHSRRLAPVHHSPVACCLSSSSETMSSARSCVAARTTGGALPASAASFHLQAGKTLLLCSCADPGRGAA